MARSTGSRSSALLVGALALFLLSGSAGATTPALQLVEAGSGFSSPVSLATTSADPSALYVVEQRGRVWRVVNGATDPRPFLDISKKVRFGGEQGLLSIAFSPTYAADHLFYAYYVNKKRQVTVSQFAPRTSQKPKATYGKDGGGDGKGGGKKGGSPFKETVLLTVAHSTYDNHNGGQVAFGPDGMLYAGIGDGGGGGDPLHSGQNPASKLGKLLRAAGPTFTSWQIAGYGLRNPWRYSFDSANGDLYIGDVGQANREEVDYRAAANLAAPANYGWNRYEGTADYDTGTVLDPPTSSVPLVFPVQEYDHSSGDCAIIGGFVYHGSAMVDEAGRYFYADLCSGRVWSMAAGGGDNRLESVTVHSPSSFGTDSAGELYVISLGDGKVYRLSE